MKDGRDAMLAQADPARAKMLMRAAQHEADARWDFYEQVAGVAHRVVSHEAAAAQASQDGAPAQPAGGSAAPAASSPDVARAQESSK